MSNVSEERSETVFDDFKPAYTEAQAKVEANRCLYCHDAPCVQACPTSINIPEFIRKIATDNVRGSAKTIFDQNILGMSCARVCPVEVLCVGDCVYNDMGVPPIQIGKLQRFSTDRAFDEKWTYYEAGPDTDKSVALVGGGPASLAAAHELRRLGHACTIYEKRSVLGGLNTTGVAPYKMKADRSMEEVQWLLSIGGIEVKTGVSIPDDIDFTTLEKDHDAVFLGLGLGPDTLLDLAGKELAQVQGAVEFIEGMKLEQLDLKDVKRALIIGGGNTAIDAVREAIGLGIPEVTMVYRGREQKMSGYLHEWDAAKQEGARAAWQTQPVGFEQEGGRITGVKCQKMDDDKKLIDGTEHVLAADLVLLAIGQSKLAHLVDGLDGIETKWGRVVVDDTGATGRAGYYAGGDCINGGKEVVNAAADGKRAALAMHDYLMNKGGSDA